MIPIMATVRKWQGKICLAFLFRVSLHVHVRTVQQYGHCLATPQRIPNSVRFTRYREIAYYVAIQ